MRVTLAANLTVHHPGRHLDALRAMARWKSAEGFSKKTVRLYRWDPDADTLTLPRGLWPLPADMGPFEVEDQRLTLPEVSFRWRGPELEPFQERAARRFYRNGGGMLVAPTGAGKTLVSMRALAAWKQPALWMVDTADLFRQAEEKAREYFHLPDNAFGTVADGRARPGTHITIAMRQTLIGIRDRTFWTRFGAVFADECDLVCSRDARRVVSRFPAHYKAGATATDTRTDKLHPIIPALMGRARVEVTEQEATDAGRIIRPRIEVVRTDRHYAWPGSWPALQRQRADDPDRNWLIAQRVARHAREGRSVLVLVQLVSQAHYLTDLLRSMGVGARFVTGAVDSELRARRLAASKEGRLRVLIATKIVNRGVDLPIIDRLHLADPYRSEPTVRQQLGRVMRAFDAKTEAVVIDYWDDGPQFEAQQRARLRLYRKRGYAVIEPFPGGARRA